MVKKKSKGKAGKAWRAVKVKARRKARKVYRTKGRLAKARFKKEVEWARTRAMVGDPKALAVLQKAFLESCSLLSPLPSKMRRQESILL